MVRLCDGLTTELLSREIMGYNIHVFCRNIDRSGWAYISQFAKDLASDGPKAFYQTVFAVKLDTSKTVMRFAHEQHSEVDEGMKARMDAGGVIEGDTDAGGRDGATAFVDAMALVDATVLDAGARVDTGPSVDAAPVFVQVQRKVPGTANPWLAGVPDGGTAAAGDMAPQQSPVLVGAVWPGLRLVFRATGGVHFQAGTVGTSPDGGGSAGFGMHGAENGLSGVRTPWNGLLGVFVGPDDPRDKGSPPAALDFSSAQATMFETLAPELRQVFFVGDGLTGTGDGKPQVFTVPAGATRLFVGPSDGSGWFNNVGEFDVTVSPL